MSRKVSFKKTGNIREMTSETDGFHFSLCNKGQKIKLNDIALLNKSSQSYWICHLPHGITQCYLPPSTTSQVKTPHRNPNQTGWDRRLS